MSIDSIEKMHSGGGRNMKDYMANLAAKNVVVALDDTEMDAENDNGTSSVMTAPGSGGGGLLANLMSTATSGNYQQAWSWYSSTLLGNNPTTSSAAAAVAAGAANQEFEIDNSSIDVDTYVAGFTGLMRINRLLFVAEHCPILRIDALRMALNFVMETYNVQLYNVIHKQLTDAFAKLYVFFCCLSLKDVYLYNRKIYFI